MTATDSPVPDPVGGPASAGRSIELEVEIDANLALVWEALSTTKGLERWFPLEAGVVPGAQGSITLSWGPGVSGTARIGTWEEGRRLGWIESGGGAVEVTVDFLVEGRSGRTVVRLVQAGFEGEDWGDYLDTLDSGWRYFLANLKHALERHPGKDRMMVWERRPVGLPRGECWSRLLGPGGLVPGAAPSVGSPGHLWSGHPVEVFQVTEGIHLAARIPDLNDALLFIELEPGDPFHLGVWLSLYGVDPDLASRADTLLHQSLDRMLA